MSDNQIAKLKSQTVAAPVDQADYGFQVTLEMFDANNIFVGYLNMSDRFDDEAEAIAIAEELQDAFLQLTIEERSASLFHAPSGKQKGWRLAFPDNGTIGFINNAKVPLQGWSLANVSTLVHYPTPRTSADFLRRFRRNK